MADAVIEQRLKTVHGVMYDSVWLMLSAYSVSECVADAVNVVFLNVQLMLST